MNEVSDLIDKKLIAAAAERHQQALARRAAAETALLAATGAHSVAKAASEKAIAGLGTLAPLDAERALHDAQMALSVATKVLNHAEAAVARTSAGRQTASGLAWAPVYARAITMRLAAAKKGDAARAMLEEADRDHAGATSLMHAAHQNGCPHIGGTEFALRRLGTEEEERVLWRGNNVDPDKPVHPWDPGEH